MSKKMFSRERERERERKASLFRTFDSHRVAVVRM